MIHLLCVFINIFFLQQVSHFNIHYYDFLNDSFIFWFSFYSFTYGEKDMIISSDLIYAHLLIIIVTPDNFFISFVAVV